MPSDHSSSLALVWLVAQFEARHLKASTLTPTHLLLGLCKIVDLDLPELVSKNAPDRDAVLEESLREVRKLRTVFRTAGVDAKQLRRNLRKPEPERRFELAESDRLRRNPAAKRIFADAEHIAELGGGVVYPVHLLYATLLAEDEQRDAALAKLEFNKKRLITVVKRQVVSSAADAATGSQNARSRLN
jgi:ATP-dependent Clp protease ATP-binding subunit ClpC